MRSTDLVARIGGDEFVILLDNCDPHVDTAARRALETAALVRNALAAPLDLKGQPYRIGASIGIALARPGGPGAHDLLREADSAMYHAKAGGRDGVMVFEDAMLADAQRGLPVGAELLMRWRRADGSMERPDVFIPVAESSGLIVPLGHWALRQACAAWLALNKVGCPLPLSLNVSPIQFRQPDFVEQVQRIFAEMGVPPQEFIFEVTEGLLIEDIDQTIARMHQLANLGIRFSMDDFGTGYSNLAYLKKMPLYELKIDKSFMRDTPQDHNSTAIVQSILAMAGHLGLRVVAEGVETAAQACYLGQHGSAFMQGYHYHRPMPLADVIAHLQHAAECA